jgi:SPP1 family predicted phage head-tail adaptor
MKNAGRRDRYITHRAETLTQDSYGQPTVSATTDTNMWAEVVYAGSAGESMKAYQIFPQRDLTFVVHHPNPTDDVAGVSIAQDDAIIFESREYEILGFEEIGRRDGLRIFCKEKGTDGR